MTAVAPGARFAAGWASAGVRLSPGAVILAGAVAANLRQAYVLVPRIERVKSRIPSFEADDAQHPARREFGRLQPFR